MGQSKFCEWDENDETFGEAVGGACISRRTKYCNNFFAPDSFVGFDVDKFYDYYFEYYSDHNPWWGKKPNACGKCYGMYPGRLDRNDPYKTDPAYNFHNLCP